MITRYDPFREALSLRHAMDQLFSQSFVQPGVFPGSSAMLAPMDVCETKNGYEVDVALPGVRPEDIEVTVDQNTLTIRGRFSHQNEHRSQPEGQMQQGEQQMQSGTRQVQPGGQVQGAPSQPPDQSQQAMMQRHQQGHNWISREMASGTFERTITFPRPIDTDKIQTTLQNGMLTILLPISEASRPKRINIVGGQAQPQQVSVEAS